MACSRLADQQPLQHPHVQCLPDFHAADALAHGTLVRVLPHLEGESVEAHALYPSQRSLSAKVRVFIDAFVAQLALPR